MIDVVVFYIDLGRPYEPLFERMTRTARQVMPGCRLVLLSPNAPQPIRDMFDLVCELPIKVDPETLVLERIRATVSWALAAERPMIFADPDLEWKKAPDPPLGHRAGVGLMWRGFKSDQPINGGVVLATPGAPRFWRHLGKVAVNLPPQVRFWWGDQLAYALMTGVCHNAGEVLRRDDAVILLIDAERYCPAANKPTEDAWALHYKGPLKEGEAWRDVYPSRKAGKSGAGNSLPGSR